jgi:hypothetical protein
MGIIKDNIKITQINKTLKNRLICEMLTQPVKGELTEQLRVRPSREKATT